jgi:hypothetical protein
MKVFESMLLLLFLGGFIAILLLNVLGFDIQAPDILDGMQTTEIADSIPELQNTDGDQQTEALNRQEEEFRAESEAIVSDRIELENEIQTLMEEKEAFAAEKAQFEEEKKMLTTEWDQIEESRVNLAKEWEQFNKAQQELDIDIARVEQESQGIRLETAKLNAIQRMQEAERQALNAEWDRLSAKDRYLGWLEISLYTLAFILLLLYSFTFCVVAIDVIKNKRGFIRVLNQFTQDLMAIIGLSRQSNDTSPAIRS